MPRVPERLRRPVFMAVVLLFSFSSIAAAQRVYYVGTSDCSDSGPGTEAAPFCTMAKAAAATANGDTVRVKAGIYRGSFSETSTNVTWRGLGTTADDVRLVQTQSRTARGWAATRTTARQNVWQFSPGQRVHGLSELGLETDLWRRYPAYDTLNSEESGVEPYVAWHTKSWATGGTGAAAQDYFRSLYCGVACEPPTISQCVDIVETVPGSWCQDDDDYGSTWTVYFHPRTVRVAGNLTKRAGDSFDLEVAIGTVSQPTAEFVRDGTLLSNMSFYGVHAGQDNNAGVTASDALRIGGDGTIVTNIRTYSKARVYAAHGLANFTLRNSLFVGGLDSVGVNAEYPGILIEDIELCCKTGPPLLWTGPWGTSESPLIFRRIVSHEGMTYRRPPHYTLGTDGYSRIVDQTYFGTHSWSIGDALRAPRHFILENSINLATSDTLRISNCTAGCVIRNNMLRGGIDSRSVHNLVQPNSMIFVNNILWGGEANSIGVCGLPNCAEYAVSDYNLWINQQNVDGLNAPLWRSVDADGTTNNSRILTLQDMRALGKDLHSVAIGRSHVDAAEVFVDPSIKYGTDTGGDDYRPVAGSPAVNAGSNQHCGHSASIVSSVCDIGPYEFNAATLTGPAVRPFGERIVFLPLSSAPPVTPTTPTGVRIVP